MRKAKYLEPPGIRIIETTQPCILNPDEIKVQVSYAGICPDDVHLYLKGKHALLWPGIQSLTGHEFSGIITEVGDTAKEYGWSCGDRISGVAWNSCGKCNNCKSGLEHRCLNMQGTSMFAEFVVVNQRQICKLPDSVSLKEGVFTDPLSFCLMNDIRSQTQKPSPDVLIFGANSIALIMLQLAKMEGAASITVVDNNQEKIELAKLLGATHVINFSKRDLIFGAIQNCAQDGYDIVYEMSGDPIFLDSAIQMMAFGGIILYSSVYSIHDVHVDLSELFLKNGAIRSFSLPQNNLLDTMRIIPKLNLLPLISCVYPFEQLENAFQAQMSNKYEKIIVELFPEE
ncbi:MAG: alcohol dehydrogenase catalytic domain-containing protein [Prevotella sp.]|jgi:threonine dehydrogenase-like Zn-dependent dehydrogenase|nr:alcohol dehydrogenase catalytic domain-containing protein [Prevotella sp.]